MSVSPQNAGVDLTVGSIPRHLIKFSIPMLMGSALQTLYSIINAYWVGSWLGTDAMAAITASFPIFFILMAVAIGLTMGAAILVSQSYGAKDMARMRRVIDNSIVLTVVVGFAFLIIGHYSADWLLRYMDTDKDVLPMAIDYLRIFVWTLPFMFGSFLAASILRGVGDSKTPLYFQAAALVATAILDPLLMFGWLGMPKLGLNGTAYATVFTQAASLVAVLYYLRLKKHIVNPKWRSIRMDVDTSLQVLKIGVPSMIQQSLVSIAMFAIMALINGYGKNTTAAGGIAMRIDQVAFLPALTMGMAVSTLAGQNIGAKRFDRVGEVFKWGVIIGGGITILVSAIVVSFPHALLVGFTKDPDVLKIAVGYLRIVGSGYVLFAVMFVANGIINGAGHTLATTIFTVVSLWAVRVPLAWYLFGKMGSVRGVWFAMVIGFAVGMVVSVAYYFSGRWKRPVRMRGKPEYTPDGPAMAGETEVPM